MTDALVPPGFRPLDVRDDFVGLIGPLWFKVDGDAIRLALRGVHQQGGAKGISADDAIARVVDMVGNNAAKVLLESGMIDFVQTGAELTGETFSDSNGKVQGATTPDGKIILVLNNLTDKTFDGVLSHEAIHATLKNVLGEDTYNTLMSRLDTMLKAGEG